MAQQYDNVGKRPFELPTLTKYGDIKTLTLGKGGSGSDTYSKNYVR